MEEPVNQQVADTQQVTSKTPATKQKNPNRVRAGRAVAERTRIAREAQKKALIEAQSIIAHAKQAAPVAPPSVAESPAADPPSETKNVFTTTQWLSVISIIISLGGIYYKREEIKKVFAKKTPPPSPVLHVDATPKTNIRYMD